MSFLGAGCTARETKWCCEATLWGFAQYSTQQSSRLQGYGPNMDAAGEYRWGTELPCKSNQTTWWLFGLFWKALLSTKSFIWLILGPLLEKFGYFLFQHLVTLTAFEQVWHERLTCFRAIKNQQKVSSFRVSRLEKEMFCSTSAMEGKDLEQIL